MPLSRLPTTVSLGRQEPGGTFQSIVSEPQMTTHREFEILPGVRLFPGAWLMGRPDRSHSLNGKYHSCAEERGWCSLTMGPHLLTWGTRISESHPGTRSQGQGLDLGGAVGRVDTWGRAGRNQRRVCYQGCHHPVPGARSCCGALGDSVEDVSKGKARARGALRRPHTHVG